MGPLTPQVDMGAVGAQHYVVMSNYTPDYLSRLLSAVEEFQSALDTWLATQNQSDMLASRGVFPTAWTKNDADAATVHHHEMELARAAGLASVAVAVTGAYVVVGGVGPVDPIANWSTVSGPKPLFSPRELQTTTAAVLGRLEAMIATAHEETETGQPAFSPAQLHPVVWTGAAAHWTSHQYRVAVREAAEALTQHWKSQLERKDVDDTVFWQQTFATGSAQSNWPRLQWPGDATDKTVKSLRGGVGPLTQGLQGLASGLSLSVRNPTTHSRDELPEQEAMERLAAYSFLARLLDQCEILWPTSTE